MFGFRQKLDGFIYFSKEKHYKKWQNTYFIV